MHDQLNGITEYDPHWFDSNVRAILIDSRSILQMDKKPQSLPKHWPKPTQDDLDERPRRIIKIGTPQDYSFKNNFVKTSKYELWDFLPKFLLEVFTIYKTLSFTFMLTLNDSIFC